MLPKARKQSLKAVAPTSLASKCIKQFLGLVIVDIFKWPPFDTFWETLGDCASKAVMKN